MSHHRGPKTITQDLVFHYDTGNEKSLVGEPTTNLVDARWEAAWSIDGSGQSNLGTRTMINEYHCRIVDVNSNTRQSEWVYNLSPNTTYTFSVRFKKISGAPTLRYQIQPYNGGSYITSYFPTTAQIGLTDIDGWQTASYTITTPANTDRVLWFMQDGDDYTTYNHSFELKGVQVEQKSHFTPFTPGTRSNTQSLIDLSRNRTISVSGVSFDSNAMMVFDGTDDAIPITTPPNFSGSGSWTMNTWFKINGAPSSAVYMNVIVDMDPTGGSANMICVNWSDMMLQYRSRPVGGSYTTINGSVLSQGVWYNATVVRYGTNETKLFLNGTQDGGTYSGNLPAGNQSFFNIGRWTDGTVFANATIPIVSIYNRALTTDEVYRNYMSLKSRFGL
jgi:hypothetical protein